ncbi:DUF262 domain-containing protein [Qipengyuania sp. R86523]|uniref:DUF262 domain-containing protein n=1 Tax=Qipengyuania sp. R86523 TaxID=3093862 RepID=UPI0037C72E40
MKTSAENRRIRQLLSALNNGELIPRPDFQRQLVWSNNDKNSFLDTVLRGYPFPEIYVAVGDVDLETAKGSELLVDGQQRVTTLYQYFTGAKELKLQKSLTAYSQLTPLQKKEFMNYEFPVRNLGIVTDEEIIEVFSRINATSYSLNAMEVHNARYRGPLKKLADEISANKFFADHRSFSAQEMRRKRDVVYALTLVITMISTYFHRDEELEAYLSEYNDEFPQERDIKNRLRSVFDFINKADFKPKSRAWKKTDLLVLIIEIDRILNKDKDALDARIVGEAVDRFYERVEQELKEPTGDEDLQAYIRTTLQATNDRSSRVNRGRILRKVLLGQI